jgi:hypothetical protein
VLTLEDFSGCSVASARLRAAGLTEVDQIDLVLEYLSQKYRAKADQWYGVMVPPTSAEAYIRTLQRGQ